MATANEDRHEGWYAVVHRLAVDTSALQQIRNEYDPTAALIEPHITLVFPFPTDAMADDELVDHLTSVAPQVPPSRRTSHHWNYPGISGSSSPLTAAGSSSYNYMTVSTAERSNQFRQSPPARTTSNGT